MKDRAFTLIELLAVVIILGILVTLIVPNVFKLLDNQKTDAFSKLNSTIEHSADLYFSKHKDELTSITNKYGYKEITLSQLVEDGVLKDNLVDPRTDENISLSKKVYLYRKSNKNINACLEDVCTDIPQKYVAYFDSEGVNKPRLIQGMTAIKWNSGTSTWDSVTDPYNDTTWYDYANKEWANAKTSDGSYWVWIPRYIYKISSGWHSSAGGKNLIDASKLVNNNDISLTTGAESGSGTRTIPALYIPIIPGETYTFKRPVVSGNIGARFYSSTRNYLGAIYTLGSGESYTFVAPENAYFFKFVDEANTLTSGYQLEKSSTATTFQSFIPAGTIDVQFSMGIDDTRGGTVTLDLGTTAEASNNKWTNQPAFTFGNTELTGIWVAKFEATALGGVANGYVDNFACPTAGDNVTTKDVRVVPNSTSWRCIDIGNAFTVSRRMETKNIYGWGTSGSGLDTHLTKNVEWGAITYLSKSVYGQGTNEIWINPANNYQTGCAGDSVSSSLTTGCLRTYETTNGKKSSTTGNITGIYDISGGAWELTAAYINYQQAGNGNSIITADKKYSDKYGNTSSNTQISTFEKAIDKKGEAVYEISKVSSGAYDYAYGWNYDDTNMPTNNEWFIRGGSFQEDTTAGPFAFNHTVGTAWNHFGFRPVLLINEGL